MSDSQCWEMFMGKQSTRKGVYLQERRLLLAKLIDTINFSVANCGAILHNNGYSAKN